MAILKFEDIKFSKSENGARGFFLQQFYFDIEKSELDRLGKWKLKSDALEIEGPDNIKKQFNFLLEQKLKELKSVQGKDAIYVYEGLLPLIGSLYFGIIDRNTNIIEIRPQTGCNLNCIFCSIDLCRRERDFVVSAEYLAKEAEKLARLKLQKHSETIGFPVRRKLESFRACKNVEIHINAQGEPLLYAPLAELVKKLKKIKGVKTISMDTNGSLLTEKKVDELVKAGITRFNISMNAFSSSTAEKIAGIAYPIEHVKKMCKYIAKKCDILLAPVWLHEINDKDIEQIIKFSKELEKIRPQQKVPFIGVQNFLEYEHGRNPVKEQSWEKFFEFLEKLEKKYKMNLKLSRENFSIEQCNVLGKPFKKGDVIEAEIVCDGMFKNEKLASAEGRIISIHNCNKKGRIMVKITRDKYNIFYGSA